MVEEFGLIEFDPLSVITPIRFVWIEVTRAGDITKISINLFQAYLHLGFSPEMVVPLLYETNV